MKKKSLKEQPQWYIISIVSGNEDTVIRNLKGKMEAYGLSDKVEDIKVIKDVITTEEIFSDADLPSTYGRKQKGVTWETFKDGNNKTKYRKVKTSEVNRYYGYIFIKMVMNDDVWFAIRNTQLITGIIGSSGKNTKPIPVSDDEITFILDSENKKIDDNQEIKKTDTAVIVEKKKYVASFSVGQAVRITKGEMKNETGVVSSINENNGTAMITIEFFGRSQEIETEFESIELDI